MIRRIFNFFSLKRVRERAQRSPKGIAENRHTVGRWLFFLAVGAFLLIVFRMTWLVATNSANGVNLSQAAENNYTYTETVYPERGTIYDRTGTVLAVDSSTYTIYVTLDKNFVDNKGNKLYAQASDFPKLIDFLNQELNISKDLAQSQLASGKLQVQFGTSGSNLTLDKKTQVQNDAQKQGIKGVGFSATLSRSYPNGTFASHLIGLAQLQSPGDSASGLKGKNGIEAAWDSILSGKAGKVTLEKDQTGRAIPGAIISQTPAVNGQSVYTTLDADLQTSMEQLMNTASDKTQAQQLSAVLMDAKSGDILAATQRPTFNPQDLSGTDNPNFTWNDLMYQLAYEPGSTMKTYTVSTAMDTGKWQPNATYFRSFSAFGTDINDWDVNENEGQYMLPSTVTFAQGFMMSSNTGMSKVEVNIGNAAWDDYLKRFGFGIPTRSGIGNEAFGNLPSSNLVTQIMSSFGQGIAVTELQMLKGWTSFANGGVMLEPHLVNKIINTDSNQVLQASKEVVGKPISSDTATNILNLMVQVNTDPTYGTAYLTTPLDGHDVGPMFVINGQPAAAKTGTAQIADPSGGGYMTGKQDNIYSAVVMYPPQNPDYIFYMTVKIPTADWTLGYIADVANPLLTQAETLKTKIEDTQTALASGKITVGNYYGKTTGSTEDEMRRELLEPVAIGNGNKITKQSISANSKVSASTKVLLLTNGDQIMPDMYGWTKSMVDQLASWYNVSIEYSGGGKNHDTGTVTTQGVNMNATVKSGTTIKVTLGG